MIKILSGWGDIGGSTTAFINLVNLFNNNGIDTTFYTSHLWHYDMCKSDSIYNFKSNINDIVIIHVLNPPSKPSCKKCILSSHEHEIFPIKNTNYKMYDKIHYVSEHQKNWHGVDYPSFVIPNVISKLNINNKPDIKIGGVIGSIDENKQTHISIQKALEDKCDKIYIYGTISDMNYYKVYVEPFIDNIKVVYSGYCNNKQYMWDSITDVYHYSKRETYGYIYIEALNTNTIFHGSGSVHDIEIWNDEKILNSWKKELEID